MSRLGAALVAVALAAPPLLPAQGGTGQVVPAPVPLTGRRFPHGKKLVATYDSLTDSTRLAVVTHKGSYYLTVQRPRLTWAVTYGGQLPSGHPPALVRLEFRTQSPQVASDSRLTIMGAGPPLEVPSAGAYSDPGVQTWSHYMRFLIPADTFAGLLAGDRVTVTVGGITERMKPDQVNAVRDLLARVGLIGAADSSVGEPR